jgi:hypothetical protein
MLICGKEIKIDPDYYKYFWIFAANRMEAFWNRYEQKSPPWSNDPILQTYKFTNAYRILDRVSQYLVKNVQYNKDWSDEDAVFRTILFKLFNKIETWELLEKNFGEITWNSFDLKNFDSLLTSQKHPIFSNAYMMCTNKKNGHIRKHTNYLILLDEMMKEGMVQILKKSKKMEDVYFYLKSHNMIGNFLAYQYTIDLNYTKVINFSENEFVEAGGGSRRGIRKCFKDVDIRKFKGWNDIIFWMTEHQDEEFEKLGLKFRNLFGRKLQAIDIQNCACEVDKYTREAVKDNPKEMMKKIKCRFSDNKSEKKPKIDFFYPPKWRIKNV